MGIYTETPIKELFIKYCANKSSMTEKAKKEERDRINWEIKIRLIKALKYLDDSTDIKEAEEVYNHFLGI